jgi:hypothetical protein
LITSVIILVLVACVVARVSVVALLAPALWHRADALGALVEGRVELVAAAVEVAQKLAAALRLARLVVVDV